jgi:predicted phosphohydrolase
MDVFGPDWKDHTAKIERNWRQVVHEDDVVLVAGDLSWAMKLEGARPDLEWLDSLPGKKVLIRGNHDYWWTTLRKVQAVAGSTVTLLQNNAVQLDGYVVCGARLWSVPDAEWPSWAEDDEVARDDKLWQRELIRLGLSIENARRMGGTRLAMVHFPPVGPSGESTDASRMLEEAGVELCVFGHLHGPDIDWKDQIIGGIRYVLVSCDQINFTPRLIADQRGWRWIL